MSLATRTERLRTVMRRNRRRERAEAAFWFFCGAGIAVALAGSYISVSVHPEAPWVIRGAVAACGIGAFIASLYGDVEEGQ